MGGDMREEKLALFRRYWSFIWIDFQQVCCCKIWSKQQSYNNDNYFGFIVTLLNWHNISKKNIAALCTLSMILPLIFMTLGVYWGNMYLAALGFGLLFILIPIMIKILPKLKKE